MAIPLHPQLRPLEIVQVGPKEGLLFSLRDPEGLGEVLVLPFAAVVLATLMDGRHTLAEIQAAFRSQTGVAVALSDLEGVIRRLDEAHLLAGERFDRYRQQEITSYLSAAVRAPSHAGVSYADDPDALRKQLAEPFTCEGGPGAIDPRAAPTGQPLCGVLCPHIDLHRGGPTFAWAYKQVAQHSDADLFVIFGTAHNPMEELFCVSRKDFDTPLGVVRTDGEFVDRLCEHLASSVAGRQVDLSADELVHRFEHSIEFQAVFLQYVLGGKRPFRIVPVLTGSFHDFLNDGMLPDESPEVQGFLAAMRAAVNRHRGKTCYIGAADLAHVGRQFGDEWLLDEQRLAEQSEDDRRLLESARRCDSAAFFRHVAEQCDRRRICGLSAAYTMLQVMGSAEGELLKYDQAVEPNGTSCVSFASIAYYRR